MSEKTGPEQATIQRGTPASRTQSGAAGAIVWDVHTTLSATSRLSAAI